MQATRWETEIQFERGEGEEKWKATDRATIAVGIATYSPVVPAKPEVKDDKGKVTQAAEPEIPAMPVWSAELIGPITVRSTSASPEQVRDALIAKLEYIVSELRGAKFQTDPSKPGTGKKQRK